MSPGAWISSQVLRDLEQSGEWDFVRDLIDTFLVDSASRIASMRKAAAVADMKAVGAFGHALKGSALVMNAVRLVEISAEIEGYAALNQQGKCFSLIERLDLEVAEVCRSLTAYRLSLPRNQTD